MFSTLSRTFSSIKNLNIFHSSLLDAIFVLKKNQTWIKDLMIEILMNSQLERSAEPNVKK